jgi:hypothetical protein
MNEQEGVDDRPERMICPQEREHLLTERRAIARVGLMMKIDQAIGAT